MSLGSVDSFPKRGCAAIKIAIVLFSVIEHLRAFQIGLEQPTIDLFYHSRNVAFSMIIPWNAHSFILNGLRAAMYPHVVGQKKGTCV